MSLFEGKPRLFGVIKSFTNAGYGFIEGQDGASHFCHWRDLPGAWRLEQYRDQLPGKSVTFEIRRGPDGRSKAARVFIIDAAHEYLVGAEIEVCDVR